MCVMYIMNVLRTGMNMSISHILVWLRYTNYLIIKNTKKSPGDMKRFAVA